MPLAATIVKDEYEVSARLRELFGTTIEDLVGVVVESVGARRDSVDDDPVTTPGTLAYIYGTRGLRRLFRAMGWQRDRSNGVESVFSPERMIKIVFQNADLAAVVGHEPQAISQKGNASEQAVRSGQTWLFPEMEREEAARTGASVWYLMCSVDGVDVRAELSFPRLIEDRQFSGFHERIFLLMRGDLDGALRKPGDDVTDEPIDVPVSRK